MGRKPGFSNFDVDGAKKTQQGIYMYIRDKSIYRDTYGTLTQGLHEAVAGWLPLRFHTIREIRLIGFSKAELLALTDHLRNIPLQDPVHMIEKETLIIHILNSQEWNNLERTHGIVYDDLVYKLNKLTAAQTYFLQSEIACYWKAHRGERRKIDEFVSKFF